MNTSFNMVDSVNNMFKAIVNATTTEDTCTETDCPICFEYFHEVNKMEVVDNDGHSKPGPDRDCEPDFIVTREKYQCNRCGHSEWIDK